jgi:hypothetical protein
MACNSAGSKADSWSRKLAKSEKEIVMVKVMRVFVYVELIGMVQENI